MKQYFSFILILFIGIMYYTSLEAQTPAKITIKGVVQDTTKSTLPGATVMLLSAKDSTLLNFTATNTEGKFSFAGVRNKPYIFKVSYVGFLPYQQTLQTSSSEIVNMGNVIIKPISNTLMEVVIKAAKAPLRMRGDTIEYDATTFKAPIGGTVEDLLRRLPGIEVDADGNVKTQGKSVRRMYVDGKTFFGNDAKSITKNLGAEAISKVQVYNEKSEQTKLTGVDDGNKEKALNFELKKEYKKGAFGKLSVAAGTEKRWAAKGNYNRFNDKNQLSFIAYGNNVNQTGVNWDDYGEFKGNNAFSNYDNGDFGFSNGGGGRMIFIMGDYINFYDGKGLTKNFGGGTNYNYDNKKTKFNASYFYNQTQLDYLQKSFKQTLIANKKYNSYDTTSQNDFRSNHSLGTRLEKEIDSANKIIAKLNLRYSYNDNNRLLNQYFYNAEEILSKNNNLDNFSKLYSYAINSTVIYNHKFAKKGRSVAVSGAYNYTENNGDENLLSIYRFFKATTFTEQMRQLNNTNIDYNQVKASALYTEPVYKKLYWQTFYNFSNTNNNVNKQAHNALTPDKRIDTLSVYYENSTMYNRVGTSLQYANNGLNISVGIAAQQLALQGKYALDRNMPWIKEPLKKRYNNITPNLEIGYEPIQNTRLDLSYTNNIQEPSFNDLQPVQNNNNPSYIIQGNPDLVPQKQHSISFNCNYWNSASFSNLFFSSSYSITEKPIVYNQIFDEKTFVTTTRPENIDDLGKSISSNIWSSFPIVKTKLTVNVSGNANFSKSSAFVNKEKNQTQSNQYTIASGLNFTPSTKFILSGGATINFTDIKYSIQDNQNQKIRNYTCSAAAKWQFSDKFFFESNFNYNFYKNEKFGFNKEMPIWNASVRRLLGKTNKFELRLAAFDILNKSATISQNASQNYILRTETNTLARYFMLSLTYNMKGFENKLQKRGGIF